MQLVITVDAEADNQWDRTAPLTVRNLEAVPRFQRLCERYGYLPTYLCTHEVVASPAFERTIGASAAAGRAEVGAHLHPWSTPPRDADWDVTGAYPSELPPVLLRDKLAALTALIGARTGLPPTSYRAGRWGFSPPQIPLLTSLGYEVDCSVTPGVSWRGKRGLRAGGADFVSAPLEPYELAAGDPCHAGRSGLYEVPVTIVHTSRLMRASAWLRRSYRRHRRSLPWRAADRVFRVAPQWLRPFPHMTGERLIAVAETARSLGLPVLQAMLHSSELLAGASPYTRTPEAADRLLERLDDVFAHLASSGVRGVTLTGFARTHFRRRDDRRAPGTGGPRRPAADPAR